MVNIKIIIALISFTSSMSYGQNKSLDEKTEIYQIVAKSLKKGGTRFTISPFTRKSILDDFDFHLVKWENQIWFEKVFFSNINLEIRNLLQYLCADN